MAGRLGQNGKHLRVFAHYVLGRLIFLFFVCHPGTLATCDGQAYLLNRYPNRDLMTTEGQMEDHRKHYTPRDPAEFAMKTGVPDELINGNANHWTPDWALSLEERFHNTVKAWLRSASRACKAPSSADSPPLGLAFIPSATARGIMDIRTARANDRQKQRWMSLAELGSTPRAAARLPARARHGGCGGHGHHARGIPGDVQMLFGFGGRRSRARRDVFGASDQSSAGNNSNDNAEAAASADAGDVEATMKTMESVSAAAGALEDPVSPPSTANPSKYGLLSSLFGGATEVYDSALSFVGCAMVTSPLGKRYLNHDDDTVPASTIRRSGGSVEYASGSAYELVGFSDIDPFEASGRRSGGNSNGFLGR